MLIPYPVGQEGLALCLLHQSIGLNYPSSRRSELSVPSIIGVEASMQIEHLGLEGLRTLPNLHPLWVHFPIALIPMSLLLGLAALWKNSLYSAVRWLLGVSTASASVAVWTGLRGAKSGIGDAP